MDLERRMAIRDRRGINAGHLRVHGLLLVPEDEIFDPADEIFDAKARRPAFGRELIAGVRAGQVAGLVMAVALMTIFRVFLQKSLFYPLQIIAAFVLGENVIGRLDARTLVVGVLVHQLGPALLWGVVFGVVVWLFKPRRSMTLMALGLFVGALAQLIDVNLLLPLLSGVWSDHFPLLVSLQRANLWIHVPIAASWLGHLVFGFALSLYPWKYDPMARTFD
jgi:hypothetical protein